jgi:hypothetical protein
MLDTAVLKCQAPVRVSLLGDFSDISWRFLISFKIRVRSDARAENHIVRLLGKGLAVGFAFEWRGARLGIDGTTPTLDTRSTKSFGRERRKVIGLGAAR